MRETGVQPARAAPRRVEGGVEEQTLVVDFAAEITRGRLDLARDLVAPSRGQRIVAPVPSQPEIDARRVGLHLVGGAGGQFVVRAAELAEGVTGGEAGGAAQRPKQRNGG